MRSSKQRARQDLEFRSKGKYSKVNPCYACGKSAGVDYFSHPLTDQGNWGDTALCLCGKCAEATKDMTDVWEFHEYQKQFSDASAEAWINIKDRDQRTCTKRYHVFDNGYKKCHCQSLSRDGEHRSSYDYEIRAMKKPLSKKAADKAFINDVLQTEKKMAIKNGELKFWAVGLNFDYDILLLPTGKMPDSMEWARQEGPFSKLSEAKNEIRDWIGSDRHHLKRQLDTINTTELSYFWSNNAKTKR